MSSFRVVDGNHTTLSVHAEVFLPYLSEVQKKNVLFHNITGLLYVLFFFLSLALIINVFGEKSLNRS